jgi:hypothetical protein
MSLSLGKCYDPKRVTIDGDSAVNNESDDEGGSR